MSRKKKQKLKSGGGFISVTLEKDHLIGATWKKAGITLEVTPEKYEQLKEGGYLDKQEEETKEVKL